MSVEKLLDKIKNTPDDVQFAEVIAVISKHYNYNPAPFRNRKVLNAAGENEGSCKIFAFAQLQQLTEVETLACFGKFYRNDVLENPKGKDHVNIRTFMQHGWKGIQFYSSPLIPLADAK